MFDLTKNIKLQEDWQKKYNIARAILHFVFVVSVTFIAYRILFPIIPFDFSLDNPNSNKNTLVSPRLVQNGEFPKKGIVSAKNSLVFNANPFGSFDNAAINLTVSKNSTNIEGTKVKINKSYQAFFFPTGTPIGFKNGTLLTTQNGSYYIVSGGMLRKFSAIESILQFGYPKSAFINVSDSDLQYNKRGNDITDSITYPNDTLFAIGDTYYQLNDGKLFPFISTRAYLSQFNANQAIAKDGNFINNFQVAENSLGFSDGTLGSSADSVYILSEGKSYPVADALTFNEMGLNWNDVTPLNQDELSVYDKQKQFTVNDPHPNGTIFMDQKTKTNFIIQNGFKLPVPNDLILKTYSKNNPVIADLDGAKQESECVLRKNLFSSTSFSCQAPLQNLTGLVGNDYQITAEFQNNAILNNINATFSTPFNSSSLMNSLSKIKTALKNR